jgi:hypothetical protein
VPASPGTFQLQLQLQPQSLTVLVFSCDASFEETDDWK